MASQQGLGHPAYLPNFPVISALGFLLQLFPGFHPLVIGKGNPIDPLQGFHFGIALPVRGGILNIKPHLTEHIWHFIINQISLKYVHIFQYSLDTTSLTVTFSTAGKDLELVLMNPSQSTSSSQVRKESAVDSWNEEWELLERESYRAVVIAMRGAAEEE